jgi:hypothetical protein
VNDKRCVCVCVRERERERERERGGTVEVGDRLGPSCVEQATSCSTKQHGKGNHS